MSVTTKSLPWSESRAYRVASCPGGFRQFDTSQPQVRREALTEKETLSDWPVGVSVDHCFLISDPVGGATLGQAVLGAE